MVKHNPHELTDEQLMRMARRSYIAGLKNQRWSYQNVWPLGVDGSNFYSYFNNKEDALTVLVDMVSYMKETIKHRTTASWIDGFIGIHARWDADPKLFERDLDEAMRNEP